MDEHAARHGVSREDAEHVVRNAEPPYPEDIGEGKYRVWGRTSAGEYIQVIFAIRELAEVDYTQLTPPMLAAIWDDDAIFIAIIHAMPMTDDMKRRHRQQD